MAYAHANHYEAAGHGVEVVVDTSGVGGRPVVRLQVDGNVVTTPTLSETSHGLAVEGVASEVEDGDSVLARIHLPRVNVDGEPAVVAGFALLTRFRSSIGGPALVLGPLHLYDLRPLAGTADLVES
jgi:hypothetical protein